MPKDSSASFRTASAGISAAVPDGLIPFAEIAVFAFTVMNSCSGVNAALSKASDGAAVEAIIRPAEMERSEPSEGRLTMETLSSPSCFAT